MIRFVSHALLRKQSKAYRVIQVVFCPLTDVQRQAYERFLESPIVEMVKNSADLCDCESGKKRGWCCHALLPDGSKWQVLVFPVIATLSKLSNHLALLIPVSSDPHEKQQRALDFLMEMVPDRWQELYSNRDSLFHLSNPEFCGKWKILKKLLRFWHGNGDKVLVFSHSVKLLKMLHQLFNNSVCEMPRLQSQIILIIISLPALSQSHCITGLNYQHKYVNKDNKNFAEHRQ